MTSIRNLLLKTACLFVSTGALVLAAPEPTSALKALNALPAEQAKKVAAIVGREGNPEPAQWHFLVHDPGAENELREYVVENQKVVATRGISQFAEHLIAEDVIAGAPLRVDSDRARKAVRNLGNRVTAARFDYELRRPAPGAAPVWTITCRDEAGEKIGVATVLAADGRLIAKEGFVRTQTVVATEKKPVEAQATADRELPDEEKNQPRGIAERKRKTDPPRAATDADPAPVAEKRRSPIQNFRRGLHGLFGGD